MKKPVEDLSKLPKWAQHRIAKLEADLKASRSVLDGLSSKTGDGITGKIIVDPHADNTSFLLRDRSTIRFRPKRDRTGQDLGRGYIDVHLRRGMININGAEGLVVLPGASNDVNIAAVHWSDMDKVIDFDADVGCLF